MVLGCMLTSVNALNVAAGDLTEADFYFSEHKLIFQVLWQAYKQDKPADIHLIAEELRRREQLQSVGGLGYLTSLAQYVGTSAHIEEYAQLVKSKALLRRMITASQQVEKTAFQEPENVSEALDKAQQLFFQIGQTAGNRSGILLKELIEGTRARSGLPFLKELEKRQEDYRLRGPNDAGITGIATHFYDLDKMVNGLGRSNLTILAGRPGMGKTALVLNFAENICFKNGLPVGIFSLEMSAEQLMLRLVSSQSGVESSRIQRGSLNGQEFQQVLESVNSMRSHTLVIDDQPGLSITELRARARRMREAHGVELLIIDYLQLIGGSGSVRSQESRQVEISEVSRNLKNLARELDIPVLCASQLSRKVEERHDHRPVMSDLRESGAIEQDADVILFLLRRDYYDPHDKPGLAELIVAKNRHGPVGTVTLTYRKELAQFANYSLRREEVLT